MAVDERSGPAPPASERRPLSFAQELLWLLDQLTSGVPIFNIGLAARLRGELDAGALGWALDEIAARHDILRTTYHGQGGTPWQAVAPPTHDGLDVVDLRHVDARRREQAAVELIAAEARRPFDLARGPVFRHRLFRCDAELHLLTLVIHHIAIDGWSVRLLMEELSELYAARVEGREPRLEPVAVQYADHAAWQRDWMRGEVLEEHLDYWRDHLQGMSPLELAHDRPRPPAITYRGDSLFSVLPADLMEAVRRFARESRATAFMVLLAVFQVLMQRYTSQDDVVLGAALAGRTREESDQTIGCFVTGTVLRLDLGGDPTFLDLLDRVKDVVLGATMYQELPLELLIDELQAVRELDRNPVFQVVFSAQTGGVAWADLANLEVEPLYPAGFPVPMGTSRLDLSMSISERRTGDADVWIEYSTDLFERRRMELLLTHYERLLWQVVERPRTRLSRLEPIGDAERRLLLDEWQGPALPHPDHPVHRLVAGWAARTPDAPALVAGGRVVTYGELNRRANRLAHRLRAAGAGSEAIVGVYANRSPEMVVGELAALKAGCAYLPLSPEHPAERLGFMLRETGARVLLAQRELLATAPEHPVVFALEDACEEWPDADPEVAVDQRALAYVIYTSGSTGQPKGVMVEHRGLSNLVAWHGWQYAVTARDRATWLAPVSFDATVWELWPYLAAGASVAIGGGEIDRDVPRLPGWLREQDVTICYLATPIVEWLLSEGREHDLGVRTLITGGDRLTVAPTGRDGPRLFNNYGATESSVVATAVEVLPGDGRDGRPPAIGRPMTNCRTYVLGRSGELSPVGVAGELHLAGAGLARGYLNRPGLTAERFVPDPWDAGGRLYRTGDLARWRVDGTLEFLGRVDEQVKIRGYRIELGEIEAVLSQHPSVRDAVVTAIQDQRGGRLVAYVVPEAGGATAADWRAHLRERMPEYLVPSAFVVMDTLPLTTSGKVDRSALPEPGSERPDLAAAYVAPRTPVEEELAVAVFGDLLGVERVGVADSFFELGGNSLQVMRLVSRVRERFGVDLDLRQFYPAPTIATLAALVEAGRAADAEPAGGPTDDDLDRAIEGG